MTTVTTPNNNILKSNPSLSDIFDLFRKDIFLNMNCHAIGTVEKFDSVLQTVDVSINYTKTFSKQVVKKDSLFSEPVYINYPLLVNCPAVVMGGGDTFLTMPIQAGDNCILLFNDRALDDWFKTGIKSNLTINRFHSIADAIALVGIHSKQNSIANYDNVRAVLRAGSAKISANPTNSKVGIANNTRNLKTLLQTLISDLQTLITQTAAITVVGVTTGGGTSGIPSNAAAITAVSSSLSTVSTQLGDLLE